jgi:hypothetical protein
MIEQVIVFAARHKREASHIGEHGSIAILPIQPQKSAFLGYGRDCFLGKPFETVSSQMPLFSSDDAHTTRVICSGIPLLGKGHRKG